MIATGRLVRTFKGNYGLRIHSLYLSKHVGGTGLRDYSTPEFKVDGKVLMRLRKETEVSMQICKQAINESNNDYVKSYDWIMAHLKSIGEAKSVKLAGRRAIEGRIELARVSNQLALIELNCETDFVSKNTQFQHLSGLIVNAVANQCSPNWIQHDSTSKGMCNIPVEAVLKLNIADLDNNGKFITIGDAINKFIGKVGENILLRKCMVSSELLKIGNEEVIMGSQHHNNKIAVVTSIRAGSNKMGGVGLIDTQRKEVAMLAESISRHSIGCSPSSIMELMGQNYLFDTSVTIQQLIEQSCIKNQLSLAVEDMFRLERGQ